MKFTIPHACLLLLALAAETLGHPAVSPRGLTPEARKKQLVAVCNAKSKPPENTPLDEPSYQLGDKKPEKKYDPRTWLKPFPQPYGKRAAQWQNEFLGLNVPDDKLEYRTKSLKTPIREDAPTVVTAFYVDVSDDPKERHTRRPLDNYMLQYERLVKIYKQIYVFTTPELKKEMLKRNAKVKADEKYIHYVTEWDNVWDIPASAVQKHNYEVEQPKVFKDLHLPEFGAGAPQGAPADHHAKPFLSAVYNVKPYACWYAAMENVWGSSKHMWVDVSALRDRKDVFWEKVSQSGRHIGDESVGAGMLDLDKFARSNDFTGDRGIVLGTYGPDNHFTIDNECWTDPKKAFDCIIFLGRVHVGSTIGMLNFFARFYMTAEIMRVNGWYMGREELVYSFMAALYPGSVSYIPMWNAAPGLPMHRPYPGGPKDPPDMNRDDPEYKMPKDRGPYDGSGFNMGPSYSAYGDYSVVYSPLKKRLAPINDVWEKMLCRPTDKYIPYRASLEQDENSVENDAEKAKQHLLMGEKVADL